jgi:hypothetical protein
MWSESARPVYVSSRPVRSLVRAIGALVVAAFVGYLIYLSYGAGLATDSASFLFYVFFVALVVAAATGIRGYVRSRTIEFYDDHVKVLGYD